MENQSKQHSISIWLINLDNPVLSTEAYTRSLSTSEWDRARAFTTQQLQDRWLRSRVALRHLLSQSIGQAPSKIEFSYGRSKKPYVYTEHGLFKSFNLSHADNLAAIAIAKKGEIGIDIEKTNRTNSLRESAKHYLSTQQLDQLNVLPDKQRDMTALHLWVAKEAFLKQTGEGLGGAIKEISLKKCTDGRQLIFYESNPRQAMFLNYLPCQPDSSCAVVSPYNPEIQMHKQWPENN